MVDEGSGGKRRGRRVPARLDGTQLWAYALATLGRRALSAGEVRQRLLRRALQPELVDEVIGRLKDSGYLDDRRFAQTFAQARLENQGLGRGRVLRDLRLRRVAGKVAEQAVQETYSETDEIRLVEDYLERRFRGRDLARELRKEATLASVFRKLRYAGFSAGASIRVLKRYASQADELDAEEEKLESERDPTDPAGAG